MPKNTALYIGRTGPMLPFIILASMGGVFAFMHYNTESYVTNFLDKTKTKIETVIQEAMPAPRQSLEQAETSAVTTTDTPHTSINPDKRDTVSEPRVAMGDTHKVSTNPPSEVAMSDTPKATTSTPSKVATSDTYTAEDTSETETDIEASLLEDTPIETEYPGIALTDMSVKKLEKKTYDILHLLVGKYPKGESISSMFTKTVVNLTHNKETDRKAIVDSMNRFMSNFPVRGAKLLSVGINGLRMEINTRRIFVDKNGGRLDVYGKTTVLLDEKMRITCISDDVQEGDPTTLSPGFKPISYTLKSTVSNKTKEKSR